MDWSYELLSDVERRLLSRLSVFPASWTLEAAEQVCGGDGINEQDVLDLLSRLVEQIARRRGRRVRRRASVSLPRDGPPVCARTAGAGRRRRSAARAAFRVFLQRVPRRLTHSPPPSSAAVAPAAADRAGERPGGARMGPDVFDSWREGRRARRRAVLVLDQARAIRGGKALARPGARGRPRRGNAAGAGIDRSGAHAHIPGTSRRGWRPSRPRRCRWAARTSDAWAVSFALFLQGLAAFELGDHEQAAARAVEAREAADACGERTRAAWRPAADPRQHRRPERRLRPRAAALR